MATLGELLNENVNSIETDADKNSKPNAFVSALAGIGSGLFKIPEGFVSLGATLIDLGGETNKVAEVEEFFAKIKEQRFLIFFKKNLKKIFMEIY